MREDGAPTLRLGLADSDATRALWSHAFRLTLTVTVSQALQVALDVHNPGNQPLRRTEALHTYVQVGSITATTVQGLEVVTYIDKVDGGRRKIQAGPVTITAETDRVYLDAPQGCIIDDVQLQRRIHVAKEGSQSTVIWNPWIEKARQVKDFDRDEYPRMVCVEGGSALANEVVIAPGGEHRLAMTILVEPAEQLHGQV